MGIYTESPAGHLHGSRIVLSPLREMRQTHAGTAGGHQVFTDGKPLKNVDAMNLLLQEGVIKDHY